MAENTNDEALNVDRDSLHILPLCDLPIDTPGLNQARLIKNVRLESMVEMFSDKATGSGQLSVEDLPKEFTWDVSNPPRDLDILRKVARLPSFDVYSLRVSLRAAGIEVNSHDALKLSAQKNAELSEYMRDFTGPLIAKIYGGDNLDIQDFSDVIKLFRDPDVKNALEKLRTMAEKLDIELETIPTFMEDYGDIFLSLSYYRQCLDAIEPAISSFLEGLGDLRGNYQLKHDVNLQNTINEMEPIINGAMANISGRFENFERGTKHMWDNVSAERFRKVESLISGYHTTIGGILCALSVKMDAWSRLFPEANVGGPGKRAEFIMIEMRQGFDKLKQIGDSAPMLSALK